MRLERDEDRRYLVRGKMSGGSLGIRTGSYGTLPQHPQNGGSSFQNLSPYRKPSRASHSGSREKERCLSSTYKCLSRRKVGMLILVVFALLAFITGFFSISREEASDTSTLDFYGSFLNSWSFINNDESSPGLHTAGVCDENKNQLPPPSHDSFATSAILSPPTTDHPCRDFKFSPPPPGGTRLTGPRACPICFVPVEQAISSMPKFPSQSTVVRHLTYVHDENPVKTEPHGGSDFGGYPSLKQRNDSFNIKESMTVHCGFVKGCRPGYLTEFNIDEADLRKMVAFHQVIVASAIFGNYDLIQQPKGISEIARKKVPFYMLVDEKTEAYMKNSSLLDSRKRIGLWRIIVVRKVPYDDPRRNGKIPKLLLHRLFPNVWYSIWLDAKLQLVSDPYQVIERFLWRPNATFAISRHYSRFDVFEEAEANKAAGKYDNSSIDDQINFYKQEGLTPYSEAKLPITSDVPEGCVIIREHNPLTNLFGCLWFNEVDRFTSRDQLSFSTVRDKILEAVPWTMNMFLDCERRAFVVQSYHRDLLEERERRARKAKMATRISTAPSPPSQDRSGASKNLVKKTPARRGRGDRKSGSKKHRKVVIGNRENATV